MTLYSHNLGQLAGMAKGEVDYDAEVAQTAADNLKALVMTKNGSMWPQGSDSTALPGRRAPKSKAGRPIRRARSIRKADRRGRRDGRCRGRRARRGQVDHRQDRRGMQSLPRRFPRKEEMTQM